MEHALTSNRTIQEWVSLYADDLFRWALHKTTNQETAKDLVQDTFLAALKSLDKFHGNCQPKTWLFTILNNKISDYHRKQFRTTIVNQSQLSSWSEDREVLENYFDNGGTWKSEARPTNWQEVEEDLLDNPEFKSVFDRCLKTLPNKWFSIIQFKYWKEKASKEICQELGITPSNFWQILHRTKLQLRKCIEKYWFKS